MTDYPTIPARIHLQIREGKLNTLSEFDLRVRSSTPEDDGTITHEAASVDIIEGLAIALHKQIRKYRESDAEPIEDYLAQLRAWTFLEEAEWLP